MKLTKMIEVDATLVKIQFGIDLMAFQYSITAVGAMMMQSALNILGSVAIAGFTAASKIEQLVTQVYVALGTTMATYCAQNMGAGKILRIRQGFRSATWMGFAYAVVAGIFVMFAGKYLTPLFLSENLSQIMDYVDIYLKCVGLFFIPLTLVNVYRTEYREWIWSLPMMAVAELIGRGVAAIKAAQYKLCGSLYGKPGSVGLAEDCCL
ncbi:MAG: MATE family efflux transporter [Ruminococcus sp.]